MLRPALLRSPVVICITICLLQSKKCTTLALPVPSPSSQRANSNATWLAMIVEAPSLRAHINSEYLDIASTLVVAKSVGGGQQQSKQPGWKHVVLPSSATLGLGDDCLWRDREPPSALLFAVKFHHNYRQFARLAAATRGGGGGGCIWLRRRRWSSREQQQGVIESTRLHVLVDDVHWYNTSKLADSGGGGGISTSFSSYAIQRDALAAADGIIFANYAHVLPILYPSMFTNDADDGRIVLGLNRANQRRQRRHVSWLPHATAPWFFLPLREPRLLNMQVLLSGATTKEWYPYRRMVGQWAADAGEETRKTTNPETHHKLDTSARASFAWLQHPVLGSDHPTSKTYIAKDYAQALNTYAACVTDGLHLNYTVAKIFEIPAAGCVLLVNVELRHVMARVGMFDSVHYIAYRGGRDLREIARVIGRLKEDDGALHHLSHNRLDHLRRRAQHLVLWRHLVAHRAAQVDASVRRRRDMHVS